MFKINIYIRVNKSNIQHVFEIYAYIPVTTFAYKTLLKNCEIENTDYRDSLGKRQYRDLQHLPLTPLFRCFYSTIFDLGRLFIICQPIRTSLPADRAVTSLRVDTTSYFIRGKSPTVQCLRALRRNLARTFAIINTWSSSNVLWFLLKSWKRWYNRLQYSNMTWTNHENYNFLQTWYNRRSQCFVYWYFYKSAICLSVVRFKIIVIWVTTKFWFSDFGNFSFSE